MGSIQKQLLGQKGPLHYHVRQALVPRKANRYHPHLVRWQGILSVFILVTVLQVGSFSTANAMTDSASVTSALLSATNNERAKNKLPFLVVNDRLTRAATLKANDMAAQHYWSHVGPDGSTPWKWIDQVGYAYRFAGENLAKNFRTPQAVVTAWMASPEHRANILDSHYSEVGFATASGTVDGKPVTLTVALYGAPSMANGAVVATERAPIGASLGIMQRLYVAGQSMNGVALVSVAILCISMGVALLTYVHRKKLPKKYHVAWYRHHGIAKAGGMLSLCLVIIFLYSGGQI